MATLFTRNGVFYAQYSLNGRQLRPSLRTKDAEEAKKKLAALTERRADIAEPPTYQPQEDGSWAELITEGLAHSRGWLSVLFQRTKDRATDRGVNFYLSKEQLRTIAERSGGRCELTGIGFSWVRHGGALFPPFAPSLDRITPRHGYSAGNCRLVCYAVNVALSDWGEEVLRRIVAALALEEK